MNMQVFNLIDVKIINSNILLDIRYATANNFLGFALYSHPLCFVHQELIAPLNTIQNLLEKKNLGLKIFDAYRPSSVQKLMWDKIQDERYVSNPATFKGSHTRGVAIDVTLVDAEGNELTMPSAFDEFSERSHLSYKNTSSKILANRDLLQHIMINNGFVGIDSEWWHFHLEDWKNDQRYPALDISFEDLTN